MTLNSTIHEAPLRGLEVNFSVCQLLPETLELL